MSNLFKKTALGILFLSLLGSQIFTTPNNFLNAQNRWITKDKGRCIEFLEGSKLLSVDHIEIIMKSKSWNIVAGRLTSNTKCSLKNISIFTEFLNNKPFPPAVINLITQPRMNDNLIAICSRMHELSYSRSTINAFKKFLLALFSTKQYPDIIDFQESLENGDYEEVSNYLNKGFRPDWIIDENLSTGLMIAINQGNNHIADLLLTCPSINLETMNREGINTLMLAIKKGNFSLAQKLLDYQGWDFTLTNQEGLSVFDLAEDYLPNIYRALHKYQPYDN